MLDYLAQYEDGEWIPTSKIRHDLYPATRQAVNRSLRFLQRYRSIERVHGFSRITEKGRIFLEVLDESPLGERCLPFCACHGENQIKLWEYVRNKGEEDY